MAKTAVINVRTNPKVKEDAEKLYAQFGITITDAINMFLYQSLNEGGLPFALKAKTPNSETLEAIKEVDDMINGKITSESKSTDEFFKEMGV